MSAETVVVIMALSGLHRSWEVIARSLWRGRGLGNTAFIQTISKTEAEASKLSTTCTAIRGFSLVPSDGDTMIDDIVPKYTPRQGEQVEVKRARLLYQSR